jgi:phosphoglycolate phosphatase
MRCVYTDLDGTLLGRGGSLFRDADGGFTLLAARALEACHRAGVEVVLKSGRRRTSVAEDARLIGQSSYIYEVGAAVVIDGEETRLVESGYDDIAGSGAPALLFDRFELEYHDPWHAGREVSHLMRGRADVGAANALLAEHGHDTLRLVDNGALGTDPSKRVYHLLPRSATKARAVAFHMRARGYAPADCIAVGDSSEDLAVADVVGRFFLVANADPAVAAAAPGNAEVTEGRNGDGFYEAVVRSLAERR